MIEIRRMNPSSEGATELIAELDAYQSSLYPAESNHFDSVDELSKSNVQFLGAFEYDVPLGCGAVKFLEDGYAEIKRMFVRPQARGKQIGRRILAELEAVAGEAGISLIRLETGIHQPEAIALYQKSGYEYVEPFGDYREDPLSVFMEKNLAISARDA